MAGIDLIGAVWGFMEELSLVACFPNLLTRRHTPGMGSGYSLASRLAGQDLELHTV